MWLDIYIDHLAMSLSFTCEYFKKCSIDLYETLANGKVSVILIQYVLIAKGIIMFDYVSTH